MDYDVSKQLMLLWLCNLSVACAVDMVKCVDASMTVNSKEVYKVVMGMFNESSSSSANLHTSCPQEDYNFEQQFALDTGQLVYVLRLL